MDRVIVQTKYEAVTRFIAYLEECADRLETRFPLAAEAQEVPDAGALIDELVRIALDSNPPGPTVELIREDLIAVAAEFPVLLLEYRLAHAEQRAFWCQAMAAALEADVSLEVDHSLMITPLLRWAEKQVSGMRIAASLAKKFREKLTRQLESGARLECPPLTPKEVVLVRALGAQHRTGQELAEMLRNSYSGSFKSMLANLVRVGVLINDNTGYHVTPAYRGP